MCKSPITIPSRKRVLSRDYNERMFIDVPCNCCSDCHSKRERELQFRFFWEAKRSKFIYFDTLTYSNKYLPRVSEIFPQCKSLFNCFSREHIQHFLKRLRRRISYHCKVTEDCFKYAIFSEFGTSEKCTHRPHYHIIFFVSANIDPLRLSEFVSKSWHYGRTDGFGYRDPSYIIDHNTLYSNSVRLTNYIAKYVSKSSVYFKSIKPLIDSIVDSINQDDFDSYVDYRKFVRKVVRHLSQFSLWSHHLGDNYIDSLDDSARFRLAENPVVAIPQSKYLGYMALPLYYVRKLFFDVVKDDFLGQYYVPNDLGLVYLQNRMLNLRKLVYNDLLSKSVALGLPLDSLDDLSDYVAYKRNTNNMSYLYQTPDDVILSPNHVVSCYTDSDVDSFGSRVVIDSNGECYPYIKFLRDNSFVVPEYEDKLRTLNSEYRKKFPIDCRHDFISEYRNRIKYVMSL